MPGKKLKKANQESYYRRIFRQNMKARRVQIGLTQAELAEKLGFAQQFLATLENPLWTTRFPSDKEELLCDVLKTTMAQLYSPDYYPPPPERRVRKNPAA